MNLIHRDAIARNLVKSLASLLEGTSSYQIVTDSYGKTEHRIVITYEKSED